MEPLNVLLLVELVLIVALAYPFALAYWRDRADIDIGLAMFADYLEDPESYEESLECESEDDQ